MKYMGSKNRLAKYLLPIILKDRTDGQYYVEPFVGGCNMIDKASGNRIGSDKNELLIEMWKGLQGNEPKPTSIPKELYDKARNCYNNNSYEELSKFIVGWIGFAASFNGRFFDGGYSGVYKNRDYIKEQINNIEKQIENIKGIEFLSGDYDKIEIPSNSVIYCDIPYQNTKQYSTSKGFDYEKFWGWCREMKDCGHKIFVSEYNAPSDFICIWEKEVTNSMNSTKTYKPIEKLFTI